MKRYECSILLKLIERLIDSETELTDDEALAIASLTETIEA
ncbi:hypothetical protein [uncultured Tenacibaculum sp.]|nr:hypothetical protein [uncultured Tenacibaculum sp.]